MKKRKKLKSTPSNLFQKYDAEIVILQAPKNEIQKIKILCRKAKLEIKKINKQKTLKNMHSYKSRITVSKTLQNQTFAIKINEEVLKEIKKKRVIICGWLQSTMNQKQTIQTKKGIETKKTFTKIVRKLKVKSALKIPKKVQLVK